MTNDTDKECPRPEEVDGPIGSEAVASSLASTRRCEASKCGSRISPPFEEFTSPKSR